jgi:hypothetical protein
LKGEAKVNADFQRYIEVEAELAQTVADVRAAEKLVNTGRISSAAFHQTARGIYERRARLMDEREALLS